MSAQSRWPIGGQSLQEIDDAVEMAEFVSDIIANNAGVRSIRPGGLKRLGQVLIHTGWALEHEREGDEARALDSLNLAKDTVELFYAEKRSRPN